MTVSERISSLYASESRRILATLVRLLGELDLAEEAMQEAFGAAAERWPQDGVPDSPRAWIVSTARFKGIDVLRRRSRGDALVQDLARVDPQQGSNPERWDVICDDQLRLVFTCCHPALPLEARVALTLREVCGLRTEEVARCYLVSPEAMKRRLSRAKALLREERIPYEVPGRGELSARLSAVLQVVYLVFNEGYSATSGEDHIRHDLTREAISMAQMVVDLLPEPEAIGLLALLLLHESRGAARVDAAGNIIPLEEQDRSRWDQDLIAEAQSQLQRAFMSGKIGSYTLQAAIASVHAAAPSVEATQWSLIVEYYDMLRVLQPGPVIDLQRAIAVAMRDGPAAGLELVDELLAGGKLASYHSAHAVRADLTRRLGRLDEAAAAYQTALGLCRQGPEKRYLQRQLEKISK